MKPIELRAGDRFLTHEVWCLLLADARPGIEPHGGPRVDLFARRLDTGQEGFTFFGPDHEIPPEEVERASQRPPSDPAGSAGPA